MPIEFLLKIQWLFLEYNCGSKEGQLVVGSVAVDPSQPPVVFIEPDDAPDHWEVNKDYTETFVAVTKEEFALLVAFFTIKDGCEPKCDKSNLHGAFYYRVS